MNELELLLRAVKDFYKVEPCGVSLYINKEGQFLALVRDDNGENTTSVQGDDLATVIRDLASKWLAWVSPSGAMFKLLQAVPPMEASTDKRTP